YIFSELFKNFASPLDSLCIFNFIHRYNVNQIFDSILERTKRQYSKPLPKKLNFKAGSAFENLTLKLDSVRKDTCGKSTLILSITLSSVNEAEKRNFIRKSWGSSDLYLYTKLRPIFLLGTTNNNSLQEGIEKEAKIFKDILQINYMDTYRQVFL
ncbi:Beta-1,3-galactosyltransferase 1, partial [Armadillidium vulgare]